jgi:Ca2+-binding RTX toxin-like protein
VAKLQVTTDEGFNFGRLAFRFLVDQEVPDPNRPTDEKFRLNFQDGVTFAFSGDFNYEKPKFDSVVSGAKILINGKTVVEMTDLAIPVFLTKPSIFGALTTTADEVLFRLFSETYAANGGDGGDVLVIGKGTLNGLGGDDVLAGFGKTHFNGGAGKLDAVSYLFEANDEEIGVTASLVNQLENSGDAKGHTYERVEKLIGSFYDDRLIGDKKDNVLEGADGVDTLVGGRGADTLEGGKGTDYASYSDAASDDLGHGVWVSLTEGRGFTGEAKGDVYKGVEALIGSAFDDSLIGSTGVDTLIGGSGDDTLQGGGRQDTLYGDSPTPGGIDGSDIFVMNRPDAGVVNIMDFDVFDRIAINVAGFGLPADTFFHSGTFISGPDAKPTEAAPTLLYDHTTKLLSYDADGTGDGKAQKLAVLKFDSQQFLEIGDILLI